MLSKNYLLLTCLILIHFLQTSSYAKQQQQNKSCHVSSCGNIHNISYPFRLKDDPEDCGDSNYEISCENNSASIYIDSDRYHVQAINYQKYTIRLADPAIKNNDTCSFPRLSPNWDFFSGSNYKFRIERVHGIGLRDTRNFNVCHRYAYSDIKKMTRGFREKLGQGGYGSVYRGKLRSGSIVAVKVLNKSGGNGQDFINEVATIGRIHHINVVKLVGYCAQRSKCALVYDFMPNGSLEKYIFSNQERDHNLLSWERKYAIAVGVARGIEYLHRGCDIQILHFDIKPHNILLDENFIPKISDFGLAKFYSTEKNTVTLTAARGTIGYVAPELINRSIGGVSYKADVYSFGMLLMEMVGQNRDLAANDQTSSQYFPDWIYDRFNKGKDIEMGNIGESDDDCTRKITRRMTIVALWCIQLNPCDRPSMSKVLEMLESEAELLQIPPRHFQSPQVAGNDDQTWGTDSTDSIALLHDDASRDQ